NMSNVVAVPHIGSATHETRYNMMACAVDNLIDALQGKIEKNCTLSPYSAENDRHRDDFSRRLSVA
ncbi:hypothetical protein MJO03_11545, partial [Salmonella enterica subsp. enterica serovar Montevideo]|nr:hypothetical protein [Salmonella enterica subsp. enterica serovar Montevideo]